MKVLMTRNELKEINHELDYNGYPLTNHGENGWVYGYKGRTIPIEIEEQEKVEEVSICIWCSCYYYTESGECLAFRTTPVIGAVEEGLCKDCKELRKEYDEKRLKDLGYDIVRVKDGWMVME